MIGGGRMLNNRSKLREKALEALSSVLPITAIVLLLCFTISPIPSSMLLAFVLGAALLIVGMALFTRYRHGADRQQGRREHNEI